MDAAKLEKLAKIKKLAESGAAGERESAMRSYERLKALYNLSDVDIEGNVLKRRYFSFHNKWQKKLICQIIYSVCGKVKVYGCNKELETDCTEREYEEILLMYSVYNKALKEHFEASYLAFLMANHIYPDNSVRVPETSDPSADGMTELDMQAYELSKKVKKTLVPRALINGGNNGE